MDRVHSHRRLNMANYNRYRLRIGDHLIDDSMIQRGSYSFKKEDRVIDSYTDADMRLHEIVANHPRVVILFSFREHDSSEHLSFARCINNKNNVEVQYWDDEEEMYLDGNFKIDAVEFSHRNIHGDNILYNSANVKLTEY